MYVPAQFRMSDRDSVLALIAKYPFGIAVSVVDGAPFVSHLPFTIVRKEPELVLAAHCARANPHWRHFETSELLAIFQGSHGYVSPRWYADRNRNVPTWNYATVHCTGTARIAQPQETDDILRALVQDMEAGAERAWSVDELDAEYYATMQGAIVAFYFTVKKIDAKFKLSQNRDDVDVAGVIDGLSAADCEADKLLARAVREAYGAPRHS